MRMSDWYIVRARLYCAELTLEQARQRLQATNGEQGEDDHDCQRLASKLDAILADVGELLDMATALVR